MNKMIVELEVSERQELEALRKKVGLTYGEQKALALAEVISQTLAGVLDGQDGKVIIINHLDIQVNYGEGGGVYMTISNNKGSGSAESTTTSTVNMWP